MKALSNNDYAGCSDIRKVVKGKSIHFGGNKIVSDFAEWAKLIPDVNPYPGTSIRKMI